MWLYIFVVVHKDGKQRVLPFKVRHILISKGAQISSDAALMALENEIDNQIALLYAFDTKTE
ncbi:MAG: hypothetical protein U9Q98_05505, partial [Bacteroidota bacterium]|nr:hypothetical protein [Bacteroidota bacterium]